MPHRDRLWDVVVASPSEKTQARFCQCGHSEHRHLESPAPTGLCIEEGCECERWSEWKAAQDAPPAPLDDKGCHCEHLTDWQRDSLHWRGRLLTGARSHWCNEWDGLPVDESCDEWPCGCVIEPPSDSQPSPAHEALIARITALFIEEERAVACHLATAQADALLRDILTALKEKQ